MNSNYLRSTIAIASLYLSGSLGAQQQDSLKEQKIDEVVLVGIGYGTLDKKEVTSAVTHLSGKDLNAVGGNAVLNAIQGKIAGLSVVNTCNV